MKRYLVGYVYSGEDVSKLENFNTLKECYNFMNLDYLKEDEKFSEDEWENNGVGRIKNYWIPNNYYFIVDTKYKEVKK